MKLIFGYDIVTSNGVIPNCLDPKFLPTIYEGSKFNYEKSRDYFIEKWSIDFAVFNGHEFDMVSNNKSVYEIINDRKKNIIYDWFYIIEPHSGFDLFFGKNPIHNTFLLDFMSSQAIDEIVHHNGKLLINYVIDGGLGINTENFNMIINFTRKNNIPDNKVYLIFSDFKLKDNLLKLGVQYNVIDYNFYLRYKSHEFNKIMKNETDTSTIVTKEDFINSINLDKKDFLLLTRHWKKHRIFLLNKLHRLGLDNNLVSWEKSYYNHLYIEELKKHDNNEEFIDLIINTSRHIDVEDLVNIMGIGFENKEMYLNTYISLVTESMFFQDDVSFPTGFLSEKIWKPIGHCQPFILAGPSNSLKYIREKYNFKTFHPYIDESYDQEDDDMKRIKMIEVEVEKFSNKTKTEKIIFLNSVKDVCIHNQKIFLDFGINSFGEMPLNDELNNVYTFLFGGENLL
jgi:hypothetical protein